MTLLFHAFSDSTLILISHLLFANPQTTPHEADDFATSGAYHILYCNANSTTIPQAAYLQALLPTTWAYIQDLLQDIILGTASPHGYAAFFKTNSDLEAVRQVYQDIADGPDVFASAGPGHPSRLTQPAIVCANPGEPDTVLQQASCNDPMGFGRTVAGVARHSGIVHLCPIFFRLPRVPRRGACPRVDRATNRFEVGDNGLELGRNQFAILVHELAHVYLAERGLGGQEEVYGIQGTVEISASASLENAQNYGFYAAGEFPVRKQSFDAGLKIKRLRGES